MATGVHSWSTTAASNATADSSVNWSEGQAPSSVNDSARAEMASVAKFYADINGSIGTGGSSTAYTITSNQVHASLAAMDNAIIAFIPHTTSGASPTLAVDGLTAKKIRFTTGNDLPAGALIAGTPYVVTYEHGVGEFLVHMGAMSEYMIPIGSGLEYWGSTLPNSAFAFAIGQAISRTTYATCFARIGTTYGAGDGSTTFNLPDKQGRVSAGKSSGTSRLTATYFGAVSGQNDTSLGSVGGLESHTLATSQIPQMSGTGTGSGTTSAVSGSNFAVASGTVQSGSLASTPAVVDSGTNALSVTVSSLSVTVNAGGGIPHPIVQPTIICNYMIRVL